MIMRFFCPSDRSRNEGSLQTSDDDSVNDNFSVISNCSENHSVDEGTDEIDEFNQQEAFEEKLTEALDGLTQKSAQGRTSCLDFARGALVKKYMPDFVYDRCVNTIFKNAVPPTEMFF